MEGNGREWKDETKMKIKMKIKMEMGIEKYSTSSIFTCRYALMASYDHFETVDAKECSHSIRSKSHTSTLSEMVKSIEIGKN